MQQLDIKYFFPLTEQINLDLDFTPCKEYEEWKHKDSLYIGNRMDQWGVGAASTSLLVSNGNATTWTVMKDPQLIFYPDNTPITIKTKKKPSILARLVYKAIGAKWERE